MRKAKSRNFILMICGVLLMLLIALVFTKTILNITNSANKEIDEEHFLSNMISTSSKIVISGNGNFVDKTPVITKTTVSNFNVKLTNPGDKVEYVVKFCNLNEYNLIYDDLLMDRISCSDEIGMNDKCDNVRILSYVIRGNKKVNIGDVVEENSCIQLVLSAEFVGGNAKETNVTINDCFLKLKMD